MTGQLVSDLLFINIVGAIVSPVVAIVFWDWRWLCIEAVILVSSIIILSIDSL